jgi:hypothetical protein
MGGGYLAGAYFFTRVVRSRQWHAVGVGFLAITVFSTLLLVTTVLHWDRFNHDHVSFWAWLVLYAVTPVVVPVLWVRNRRTDPGGPSADDVVVPLRTRRLIAAAGAGQLAVAVAMFVRPQLAIERWPWTLTPLTARTLSAFIAFPAAMWLCLLFDGRWSSFEIPVETASAGLALVAVALVRGRGDLTGSEEATWVYTAVLVAVLGALVALRLAMGRRRRSAGGRVPDSPDGPAAAAGGTGGGG